MDCVFPPREVWTVCSCHQEVWTACSYHREVWTVCSCHREVWTVCSCHLEVWTGCSCHCVVWTVCSTTRRYGLCVLPPGGMDCVFYHQEVWTVCSTTRRYGLGVPATGRYGLGVRTTERWISVFMGFAPAADTGLDDACMVCQCWPQWVAITHILECFFFWPQDYCSGGWKLWRLKE